MPVISRMYIRRKATGGDTPVLPGNPKVWNASYLIANPTTFAIPVGGTVYYRNDTAGYVFMRYGESKAEVEGQDAESNSGNTQGRLYRVSVEFDDNPSTNFWWSYTLVYSYSDDNGANWTERRTDTRIHRTSTDAVYILVYSNPYEQVSSQLVTVTADSGGDDGGDTGGEEGGEEPDTPVDPPVDPEPEEPDEPEPEQPIVVPSSFKLGSTSITAPRVVSQANMFGTVKTSKVYRSFTLDSDCTVRISCSSPPVTVTYEGLRGQTFVASAQVENLNVTSYDVRIILYLSDADGNLTLVADRKSTTSAGSPSAQSKTLTGNFDQYTG